MSEIAKVLSTIALEKLASPDPITREAWDYHMQVIASAIEPQGALQELYFCLRVFADLSSREAFSHPASRWMASKVDPVKLEKEISELMSLPDSKLLEKLKKAVLEAFKITIQERKQYRL